MSTPLNSSTTWKDPLPTTPTTPIFGETPSYSPFGNWVFSWPPIADGATPAPPPPLPPPPNEIFTDDFFPMEIGRHVVIGNEEEGEEEIMSRDSTDSSGGTLVGGGGSFCQNEGGGGGFFSFNVDQKTSPPPPTTAALTGKAVSSEEKEFRGGEDAGKLAQSDSMDVGGGQQPRQNLDAFSSPPSTITNPLTTLTPEQLVAHGREIIKDRAHLTTALTLVKSRYQNLKLVHEELGKQAEAAGMTALAKELGIDALSEKAAGVVGRWGL